MLSVNFKQEKGKATAEIEPAELVLFEGSFWEVHPGTSPYIEWTRTVSHDRLYMQDIGKTFCSKSNQSSVSKREGEKGH